MDGDVTSDGFGELIADFTTAPMRVRFGALAAVRTTSAAVERSAKGNAPRRRGRLAGSITHEVTVQGNAIEGEIGPTVFYGPFVEEGTALLPPRPYLGPALDEHTEAFVALVAAAADPF